MNTAVDKPPTTLELEAPQPRDLWLSRRRARVLRLAVAREQELLRPKRKRSPFTITELTLYVELERRGVRHRRQVPVRRGCWGAYRLDALLLDVPVAVEVDGPPHRELIDALVHDFYRDAYLVALGVHTIRVSTEAVAQDVVGVVDGVLAEAALSGGL